MSQNDYSSASSSSRPSLTPDRTSTSNSLMDADITNPLTPSRNSISHSSTSASKKMSGYQQGVLASGEFPGRPRQNSVANPPETRNALIWQPGQYTSYPPPGLSQSMYAPPQGNQNVQHMHVASHLPNGYAAYRINAEPGLNGTDQVLLSTVRPGSVYPQENQLNTAYAYGIQRSDGTFTRLVRADMLGGSYSGTYPISQGPEGLIILPEPRQQSPSRRQGPLSVVSADVVASLPVLGAQRQTPIHEPGTQAQHQIDQIVAQSSMSPSPQPRRFRKEKIYCDKWIHEGICAFTQMGCKYKHEMPTDKATQMSLGLTHGFPNWYRRTYAVQLNTSPPTTSTPTVTSHHSRSFSGNWRRIEGAPHASPTPSNASYHQPGAAVQGRGSFGPIAPPLSHSQSQAMFSNNPYSILGSVKSENEVAAEANEVTTWRGRHH